MLKEFKEFISRGNVLDLAVGVIIGSAFTAIVNSLVTNLINPFIGLFLGKIDLSDLQLAIGGTTFKFGGLLKRRDQLLDHCFCGLLDRQSCQ